MLKLQITVTKRKITNPSTQSIPLPPTPSQLQGFVVSKGKLRKTVGETEDRLMEGPQSDLEQLLERLNPL